MFKQRREMKKQAAGLYAAVAAQSRLPAFFTVYHVPDTIDGRFDLLSLHCYLMMRRFLAMGEKRQSQALFDVFFKNMEISLREMGIGDMGIPKHMKRMMKGFNGRADHYERAILAGDAEDLKLALIQNIYGTVENPDPQAVSMMADYVFKSADMTQPTPVFAPLAEDALKKKESVNA